MRFPEIRIASKTIILLLGLAILQEIQAETTPEGMLNTLGAHFSASIDWQAKALFIRISAPVDQDGKVRNRATLMSRKENELREFFPSIFPLCLHDLRIDSDHIFRDLMAKDPAFSVEIEELANQVGLLKSVPAKDFKSISLEYRLSFQPTINGIFIDGSSEDFPRLLAWQPAADYTGLIIYVDDNLPWYGTDQTVSLVPSLFPRIFDEDGRLLSDRKFLDPNTASQHGVLSFAVASDPKAKRLVGIKPLVVSARALYGITPTDLMISRTEADILLYNESTREALRHGKVLVILSPKILQQSIVP